jgi:hypothetical protein
MKLRAVFIAVLLIPMAVIATQTNSDSEPDSFPLSVWKERNQVTQIPWRVSVGNARYRSDLRQELSIWVSISPLDLKKSGDTHDVVLFARVLDGATPIASIYSIAPDVVTPFSATLPAAPGANWTQIAIVRPGKYKLELAVLDRATGRYSTRYEDVSVPWNEADPLEQSFLRFPAFEFVEMVKQDDLQPTPISSPRSISDRMNTSRMTLLTGRDLGVPNGASPSFVINKSGRLKLSVITILSPPESALENTYRLSVFQNNLANFLSVFSQLDVVQGTSQLTAIDLTNRTLEFDRKDLKDLTKEMLEDAINKDTSTVSIDALAGQGDRGRFFRDVLRARFEEAEKETTGAEHVIIVVAARSTFPKGSSVLPLKPERDCFCRVIYVRFALEPNESDDIDKLLRPYKPRVFEPLDWQEFRKNFATIYDQLIR